MYWGDGSHLGRLCCSPHVVPPAADNKLAKFLLSCLKCCFWCLEKFIKFLNRNAYIMVSLGGVPLLFGGRLRTISHRKVKLFSVSQPFSCQVLTLDLTR